MQDSTIHNTTRSDEKTRELIHECRVMACNNIPNKACHLVLLNTCFPAKKKAHFHYNLVEATVYLRKKGIVSLGIGIFPRPSHSGMVGKELFDATNKEALLVDLVRAEREFSNVAGQLRCMILVLDVMLIIGNCISFTVFVYVQILRKNTLCNGLFSFVLVINRRVICQQQHTTID
jgi:hypothetical protein